MVSALAAVSATATLAFIGVMAGVFFAFSVSVMIGLDRIRADQAILAMQSINRKILNPVFLTTFVGAPIAAAVTGALLLTLGKRTAGILFLLAGAMYVLGALMPTVAVNVPMNDKLDVANVPSDMQEAARTWSDYSTRWTRWNTMRAVLSSLSLLLAGLAIYAWGREG